MKKLLLLFVLLIITSTAFSQTVSLIITGDNKPVEAVHVIKSNQVIAVTDSLGLVSIPAVDKDSVIILSHLLYEDMILPTPTTDTLLSLQPKAFHLEQTTYSLTDGWPLLKRVMKPGMTLGHSLKENYRFSSIDTVYTSDKKHYFSVYGSAFFYSSNKRPVVKINSVKEIGSAKEMTKKSEKDLKRWFTSSKQESLMIGQFFGLLLCSPEPRYGLIVEYKGKDNNHDIFSFYEPPVTHNYKAKVRGLAYINSESGFLERVHVALTPIDVHISNLYEMDIVYTFFDSSNSFLPSNFQEKSYKLADDRSVISETRSHLTVYY